MKSFMQGVKHGLGGVGLGNEILGPGVPGFGDAAFGGQTARSDDLDIRIDVFEARNGGNAVKTGPDAGASVVTAEV